MQAKTPCSICNQETADADVVTIQRVATKEGIFHLLPGVEVPQSPEPFVLPTAACSRCVAAWKAADPTLPAHLALGAADHGSFLAPKWQDEKGQAPAGYVH